MVVYTDGSYFRPEAPEAPGYAVVFVKEETADYFKVDVVYGVTLDKSKAAMWNVGGELEGALTAINLVKNQYRANEVDLYFDYAGIEFWAEGKWKTNKPATQDYKRQVALLRNGIRIRFHKVSGHTGVLLNELADMYAKKGIYAYLKDHSHVRTIETDLQIDKPKIAPVEKRFNPYVVFNGVK